MRTLGHARAHTQTLPALHRLTAWSLAAVDGVCLQTSESIGCAEELGLPAVVVLNKIDLLPEKEAAQVTRLSSSDGNVVDLPRWTCLVGAFIEKTNERQMKMKKWRQVVVLGMRFQSELISFSARWGERTRIETRCSDVTNDSCCSSSGSNFR